jgi:hypothetical protein
MVAPTISLRSAFKAVVDALLLAAGANAAAEPRRARTTATFIFEFK